MNRTRVNFIIDALAFSAFVLLSATGVLLRYVLPPGSGHFSTLWGLDRHDWGHIHFWIAVGLLSTLSIHLLLHWRWAVCVVRGRPREGSGARVALAVVGTLALVGLAISPFFGSVEQTGVPPHKLRALEQQSSSPYQIDGSMTLREVEQSTGVPASEILSELGLPSSLPTDVPLGRLRRTYAFQMDDIRRIVQTHLEKR